MPLVSVVIPALNSQATLYETLQSLYLQTFKDFDVVLVNDGSSDDTKLIAERFSDVLNIRTVNHEYSIGVAQSINDGIQVGDSEYIARLDSDDLANPLRLEKQIAFMTDNAKIGVCGSDMKVFTTNLEGEKTTKYILSHPKQNSSIRTALIQRCAIAHPSILCRRSVFDLAGFYDTRFDFAEDYELWCRASLIGIQFANISEPLTHYRSHPGQVSSTKNQIQYEHDIKIKARYISALLQGDPAGYLPQFFSLQTRFTKESASAALLQCTYDLMKLGRVVADLEEYAQIVSSSINRHYA